MSILKPLDNQQGWLKAGFLGFPKSGKTHTAIFLAIGTRKAMKLRGPIGMFDTESGSNYIAEMVRKETGQALLGFRQRSFQALTDTAKACLEEKVSVFVVDSVTHPWKELCDSYLVQLNDKRKAKNLYALQKLEFQHWSAVKSLWQAWADFYLNAPMHIIICGRAGYEYDMARNDETGRKRALPTAARPRSAADAR